MNKLQKKLRNARKTAKYYLDQEDVQCLHDELIDYPRRYKANFINCLKSFLFCCQRDRLKRLKEKEKKAFEYVENSLDIRSFAKVNANLNTLLRLIFNKKQALLF